MSDALGPIVLQDNIKNNACCVYTFILLLNFYIIFITVFDEFTNIVVIGLWLKLNKKLETYKIEKCLNHD